MFMILIQCTKEKEVFVAWSTFDLINYAQVFTRKTLIDVLEKKKRF